jgi:predicted metalloenzyme YecM
VRTNGFASKCTQPQGKSERNPAIAISLVNVEMNLNHWIIHKMACTLGNLRDP